MVPVVHLRRRLKAAGDVLGGMLRNAVSMCGSLELTRHRAVGLVSRDDIESVVVLLWVVFVLSLRIFILRLVILFIGCGLSWKCCCHKLEKVDREGPLDTSLQLAPTRQGSSCSFFCSVAVSLLWESGILA